MSESCEQWTLEQARHSKREHNLEIAVMEHELNLKYPAWQGPLHEALLELDKTKLKAKIAAAETAIAKRLEDLSQYANHEAERHALQDGVASLRVLKRVELGERER